MNTLEALPFIMAALLAVACDDDFASYNEVQGFRVLAMASDRPELLPTQRATLSALVSKEASYQWNWCPLAGRAEEGYPCQISHAQLQTLADQQPGPEFEVPSFDLGRGETAVFEHSMPPAFFGSVCDYLITSGIPDGYDVPTCQDSFVIQVSLQTSAGGPTIRSVLSQELLLNQAATPNQPPIVGGVQMKGADGRLVALGDEAATVMRRGERYELILDVQESASESYQEPEPDTAGAEFKRENLTVTWFYQGGEIGKELTAFIPGDETQSIETLRNNTWEPPSIEDLSDSTVLLHFVIRDSRGGTTWLSREIELVTP